MNKWITLLLVFGALFQRAYAQDYLPDKAIDPGKFPTLPSLSQQKTAPQAPARDDPGSTRILVPQKSTAELVEALTRQDISFKIESGAKEARVGSPVSILGIDTSGLNMDALRIIRTTCPECQGIPDISPTFGLPGNPNQGSGLSPPASGADLITLVGQCSMSKDLQVAAEQWLTARGEDVTALKQARCPQKRLAEMLAASKPSPEKNP